VHLIFSQDGAQMGLTEDEHSVQELRRCQRGSRIVSAASTGLGHALNPVRATAAG
jgi:hypothetical protein